MKKEKIQLTPIILELNEEANDIYMELTMCILTNKANLNKARFTNDFIDGVIENQEKYIGIPLVASRFKLENGNYKSLSHEFNRRTGELNTDVIGSFTSFWKEEDDGGTIKLMGSAKIFKRYPNVCEAIKELYDDDSLRFSCEVLVAFYGDDEDDVRTIPYSDGTDVNELFGSCVVTSPAEVKSKADILIAEALIKDLTEGGEIMGDQAKVEVFNKGVEIKYHGKLEISALKLEEVASQIYNLLNPINPKDNYRKYNYYIIDVYTEYVIVEDWNSYNQLYKISYKIENDTVILDAQENWISGYRGFIPDGVSIDDLLAERERLAAELASKIQELNEKNKEELAQMDEKMQEQLNELQAEVTKLKTDNKELSEKVDELNGVIVSQKELLDQKGQKEAELNSQIEELTKIKEQVELAQKEKARQELNEKYSKLLSKEVFESEDVKMAIEACDTSKLNELVVAEIAKRNEDKKGKNEIVALASKQEDLTPVSTRDYLLSEVDGE
ncbi:hypothetical protein [Paenibacillus dendritiformis]|uniref:hypothetical protein n=1 Tax=Paenibacillus dendritiformis TaxID=130049 RepID=UPI00387E1A81